MFLALIRAVFYCKILLMENVKEKIKEFNKLIKKYPDMKELYLGRAKLYGKIKQYKKAFNDYEKVYTGYISNDIADICERNNLIVEAEQLYNKAINLDKNNSGNYLRRAYFYMRTKRNEKAFSDFKTCLEISPQKTLTEILIKKLSVFSVSNNVISNNKP